MCEKRAVRRASGSVAMVRYGRVPELYSMPSGAGDKGVEGECCTDGAAHGYMPITCIELQQEIEALVSALQAGRQETCQGRQVADFLEESRCARRMWSAY